MTVHVIKSDSKESDPRRQSCRVVLPADVEPGRSRLKISLVNGHVIEAEVPKEARGGDILEVTPNGDRAWTGALVRQEQSEESCERSARASEGEDVAHEFVAVVPDGVMPGRDQLTFSDGNGHKLTITVPKNARAGDQLLFKEDQSGQFRCCLNRSAACPELRSRPGRGAHGTPWNLVIPVPADAVPGETLLPVDLGVAGLTSSGIRVPATALPGDYITLTLDEERNEWIVSIIRGVKTDVRWKQVSFPSLNAKPTEIFERLLSAVRCAGAYVSSKITRGTAPPLNILGMLACEHIEAGEELVRMPSRLHITAANCKALFPDVFREAAGVFFKGRNEEAAFSACLARVIGNAVDRCSTDSADIAADVAVRPEIAAAMRVWEAYALALASDDFDRHPLVRRLNSEDEVVAALAPSREHRHLKMFVGDIMFFYEQFVNRVQAELVGSGFTLSTFWLARLSTLSRAFSLDGRDCMVPVCDFFNHHPQPGAEWRWDAESQAMILTAIHRHQPGEEIFISYGTKSNTSMFRCYGFVMPPAVEPSWGYFCLPQNMPEDFYKRYLPERMANFVFQLETFQVEVSLATVLNACVEHGTDADEFLYSVCKTAIATYEDDSAMTTALEALRRARAADAASADWWQYISGDIASCCPCDQFPDWSEALMCVRMSEYLCLTAHLEIVEVFRGLKTEDQCLAGAKIVRDALLTTLAMLRDGHQVVLEEAAS